MFTVMFHSLLIGAALFVPIPLLDDRLAAFFWKRMVSDLAGDHKRQLTPDQLLALSYQSRWALSEGCLFFARRLFKELLQEIIFILEWRKAINLASDAYYSGYLLNELFAYDGFDPAKSAQYALALQKAKQGLRQRCSRIGRQVAFEHHCGIRERFLDSQEKQEGRRRVGRTNGKFFPDASFPISRAAQGLNHSPADWNWEPAQRAFRYFEKQTV
jgi:hypothetical protein